MQASQVHVPDESVACLDDHGRKVQAMFTTIAHGYDRANRLMSMGTDVRWRRRSVNSLLDGVAGPDPTSGAGARILDLCAGTLDSTLEIHRRYPQADLVGGDFSAGMLAHGKARLRGPAAERITAKEMDAHAIPEPDESFDALFCAFGVRNLSDVPTATRDALRVLKPGGRLCVLEFFRPRRPVTRAFHTVYNSTVLPAVGWACTGNLDAYLYLPRSIGAFTDLPSYVELLGREGFVDIDARELTMGVASVVTARKAEAT